jgi:hypothetical protein
VRLGRTERKLLAIGDRLAAVDRSLHQARDELAFHRHLDDDARRDALVSGHPIDRADAAQTASDVARFERIIAKLEAERNRLEQRRRRLLAKLD